MTRAGRDEERRHLSFPRAISELQRLDLEELLQSELAELAAAAGLLEAAERGEGVEAAAVDVHLAGAEAAGNAFGAGGVARPDAAGQAVHGVVRDADRVVVVLVREDGEHGAEDLLAGDGHLRLHTGEDGRLDVVALRQAGRRVGAAEGELGAFLDADADVLADALALLRRGERTQPGFRRARVAWLELRGRPLGDLQYLLLPLARNEHPRSRRARLAGVEERVGDRDAHRLVEVGVVQYDHRRLAAQLQRDSLNRRGGELRDSPPGRRGSGEGDHVYPRMADEHLAERRPEARH